MIPRVVRRRIRPLWFAALASAAWVNRRDIARWTEFVRRAALQRGTKPMSEWITEAKVRAAVSSDPVLRRDPALKDVAVRDGVVTLLTTSPSWPNSGEHVRRLKRVKGVNDVAALELAGV